MIRKGKLMKSTAIALAIISVFGSTLSSVSATEIVKNTEIIQEITRNSEVVLNTTLKHATKDQESSAHKYLVSSKLKVVNGKTYMSIVLDNSDNMFIELKGKVNGEEVETKVTSDDEKKQMTMGFEINSLEDDIVISFTYDTGRPDIFPPNGLHTSECRVISEITSTEDSEVDLNTTLKHATKDQESSAHKYLVSSKLKVVNGKTYMSIVLDNSDNMFIELKGKVNGEEVETKVTSDDEKKQMTMEFEINSLEDDIVISFTYDTGRPDIFPPNGLHTSECRVISEIASDTVTPPTEDEEENDDVVIPPTEDDVVIPPTEDDAVTSPTPDVEESEYKDGNYTINVTTESEMAKQFLAEVANIKIEDGKIYATFNMTGSSLMSDINVKVDGKLVDFKEYEKNGDNVEFTFEVASLDSKITLGMYVQAMGRNVEFEVSLDKKTLKECETDSDLSDSNNKPNNGSNNSSSSNSGSSNDETTSSEDTVVEGTTVKEYTIKNEVVYDNEIGYNMVRQYLNEITKIEKIDGKMYATLTFKGVDLMNSHKVYVNGSLVNHTITSKTSDSISIRFEISDIKDDIQVQLFVVPMNKTVKFGVELLEDTLTFVKEYTVEDGDLEDATLPQTGSAFGSEILLGLGGLLTASGALLRRKRK